jgi:hypothetical protein
MCLSPSAVYHWLQTSEPLGGWQTLQLHTSRHIKAGINFTGAALFEL